jgi:hypothetical protein
MMTSPDNDKCHFVSVAVFQILIRSKIHLLDPIRYGTALFAKTFSLTQDSTTLFII